MKKIKVVLLLSVFLISIVFILNLLLINSGSEKIPAFMLRRDTDPEITEEQRGAAEKFFERFPFVFKECFDKFLNDKKGPGELKYRCVLYLNTKNSSWTLKYYFDCLKNNDSDIRSGAADGLQLYQNNEEIFSKITEAWVEEKDLKVYTQLARALSKYDGGAIEVFRNSMNDPDNKKRIISALSIYDLTFDVNDLNALKKLFDESGVQDKRFLVGSAYLLYKNKLKPVLRWGINGKDIETKEMILKLLKDGHL